MSNDEQDGELRGRFARLREEVTASAPPFARISARPGQQVRGWRWRGRWTAASLGLATMAVVALAVSSRLRNTAPDFDSGLTSVAWAGPTDFLLDTPGRGLLEALPSFGVDWRLGVPGSAENTADGTLR